MSPAEARLKEMPSGMTDAEWSQRVNLAACYRLIAYYGWDDLVDTHISARVPGPAPTLPRRSPSRRGRNRPASPGRLARVHDARTRAQGDSDQHEHHTQAGRQRRDAEREHRGEQRRLQE